MADIKNIGVIGAGSWGTAIANLLANKGHSVVLWAFEQEVVEGINGSRKNPLYLPFLNLNEGIKATSEIKEAVKNKDCVVSSLPSAAVRKIWEEAHKYLEETIIVNCTKGFEPKSLKLMHEILEELSSSHPKTKIAVLSGPSFAVEVAQGKTTSVAVASKDEEVAKKVQELFRTDSFLTFVNHDIVGVEVGGAVKNVIAIASGIIDGMEMGDNARATIITRGLYEMIKIGLKLGAHSLTFSGLSGIGDLVLTCTGTKSRNHKFGVAIGKGESPSDFLNRTKMVVEGWATAKAVHELAQKFNLKVSICETVYDILYNGLKPYEAVKELSLAELGEELRSIM